MERASTSNLASPTGLSRRDLFLLWMSLPTWIVFFIIGTLVASEPYRNGLATFEGGARGILWNGLMVAVTYSLPNIALLCILASVLGAVGAKARLGSDTGQVEVPEQDISAPSSSAVLRGFLVYLTLISGVLVLGPSPTGLTQIDYVRLAGVMSVISFLVSYHPTIFGQLLERSGRLLAGGAQPPK
jgi:hypothetical protein